MLQGVGWAEVLGDDGRGILGHDWLGELQTVATRLLIRFEHLDRHLSLYVLVVSGKAMRRRSHDCVAASSIVHPILYAYGS